MSNTDYAYIRAWGAMKGLDFSTVQTLEAKARATDAPHDAYAINPTTGGWLRYSEMREDPDKWRLYRTVAQQGHGRST